MMFFSLISCIGLKLVLVVPLVNLLATDAGPPTQVLCVLEACHDLREGGCDQHDRAVQDEEQNGRHWLGVSLIWAWAVCHKYRDMHAVDVAAASKGRLTSPLLLMQSGFQGRARLLLLMEHGCSPAARQLASELLKIFKVNTKS